MEEFKKSAWLLRPSPHKINRLSEFKIKNIIAIGWPCIGNLSGKSREELKQILSKEPYKLESLHLGNAYATVDIFVNQMQKGDLVLIPYGADIYFAEVTSDYIFDKSVDSDTEGYPHQRKIKWLSNTSRKTLSMPLRQSLKPQRTVANLSHHYKEIDYRAHGKEYTPEQNENSDNMELSYPLRPNFIINFKIPKDITKNEAKRLSDYFASLYFTE